MLVGRPGADKEGRHLLRVDLGHPRWLPTRRVILVDDQCTDALDRFATYRAAQVEGVVHEVALQAQVVREALPATPAQQFQRDGHHQSASV